LTVPDGKIDSSKISERKRYFHVKAVIKAKRAKGMEFRKVPVPRIGLSDVLIKVNITSICGTDVHIHDWTRWAQHRFVPPCIIGHEFAGNKPRQVVIDGNECS
jgi:D-arabinose 1-dehydrogenase-like Zn-dependent alcohol dehydrogenase